ncbi:hypothetical protein M2271_006509 [Streptomyces sp. LBL]|uniref:hypothetical protein n=1 Tax=Streptomyces sp. LBL TaxID=2940562 RepID=UPI0024748AD9|nr:hypothetical protein [Streptomyces sp. LBL]MDH6628676.1 hypothetical protein [Streptomyces sp. LBL]
MSRNNAPGSVRHKRRTPFVIIESATARDARLSYRELGLLTYLLDQSEDWQVRSEQLSQGEGREGRDAVRKSLHKLAWCGYYRLERRRYRNGKTAMGTAISDHPVEQWAADYVTFGNKLDIPVVEQEDGTFLVKYADGTLGSDGFDAPAEDVEPPAEGEEEPQAVEEEPEPPAVAAPPEPKPAAKKAAVPKKTAEEKAAEVEEKAAQERALDEAAHTVATWWWEHAEKHLGKYVGQKGGFVAVRKMVRRALDAGYSQLECAKALQHACVHFPAAQQWQNALGVVTNHIQPKQPHGRIPYSDSSTWTMQGDDSSTTTVPDDDADDATFGVLERL